MAALKPIKPTVCKDAKVWKSICETAQKNPTSDQISKMHALQAKFEKVYKK